MTLLTALLLILSFVALFLNILPTQKSRRATFVVSALGFSVFIFAYTEMLSALDLLTSKLVWAGWLAFFSVNLAIIIKQKHWKIDFRKIAHFNILEVVLAVIFITTLYIAIIYPPTNYDSMTYHLPRIEHWIQNHSIHHYFTTIERQTKSAPFAEMCILQGRIMSGDNYLMNLVQCMVFGGSLIVISLICKHLKFNRQQQLIACVFFATLPTAIMEATSTQTDMAVTFFILCFVERLFVWKNRPTIFNTLTLGAALGLSILTKGTAYVILFPFVIYLAVFVLKNFRTYFAKAAIAAAIALTINAPHYTRNYLAYSEPLGKHEGTVSDFSLKSFLVTLPSNLYSNTPMPSKIFNKITDNGALFDKYDLNNKTIFPYGIPLKQYHLKHNLTHFHEDYASNPIHTYSILIAIPVIFFVVKRNRKYTMLTACSCLAFCYFIPWQPWITRLQLPLFALAAPLSPLMFGVLQGRWRQTLMICAMAILTIMSIFPLKNNVSRPLSQRPFVKSRFELVFTNNGAIRDQYTQVCKTIDSLNISNLGIIIGGNTWEYPLWAYHWTHKPAITHISEDNIDDIDASIDGIFILNRTIDGVETILADSLQRNVPCLLVREGEQFRQIITNH